MKNPNLVRYIITAVVIVIIVWAIIATSHRTPEQANIPLNTTVDSGAPSIPPPQNGSGNTGTTAVKPGQPVPQVVYTPAGAQGYITVDSPAANELVAQPLRVRGEAVSSWFFEAQFPVTLTDATGKIIAQVPANANGNWMSQKPVPFTVDITYTYQPSGSRGYLILHNDNPSGDPARDMSVKIPIVFK